MSREARRESFSRVEETCPTVDSASKRAEAEIGGAVRDALCDMVQTIKDEATGELRTALIEALEEKIDMERERDDALAKVENLEEEVRELEEALEAARAAAREAELAREGYPALALVAPQRAVPEMQGFGYATRWPRSRCVT